MLQKTVKAEDSLKPISKASLPRIKLNGCTLRRMYSEPFLKNFRIAVLGSKGVGKTSLIRKLVLVNRQRMSTSDYMDITEPIMEDGNPVYLFKHGSSKIELEEASVFDNKLGEVHGINTLVFRAKAFMLVFNVNDVKTFDNVSRLKDAIQKLRGTEAPILIVGNKADKPNFTSTVVTDCIISIDWELTYVETSATRCQNISKLMPSLFLHKSLIHYRLPFAENIIRRHSQKHHDRSPGMRQSSVKIQRARFNSLQYPFSVDRNNLLTLDRGGFEGNLAFKKQLQMDNDSVSTEITDTEDEETVSFVDDLDKQKTISFTQAHCRKINKTSFAKLFTCLEGDSGPASPEVRQVIRYSFKSEPTSTASDFESEEQGVIYHPGPVSTESPEHNGNWMIPHMTSIISTDGAQEERKVSRGWFTTIRRYFKRQ